MKRKNFLLISIPYLMPVGPAIVLAMTIYSVMIANWDAKLVLIVSATLATLFEMSGWYIAHGFVLQVEKGVAWKVTLNLAFLIIFVAIAVGVIIFGRQDIGSDLIVALLAAFPVMASMVYITQGMRLREDKVESTEEYRADKEWQQSLELKKLAKEAQLASKYGININGHIGQQIGQNQTDLRTNQGNVPVTDRLLAGKLNKKSRLKAEAKRLDSEGYKQIEIASKLGVSDRTIRRWFNEQD